MDRLFGEDKALNSGATLPAEVRKNLDAARAGDAHAQFLLAEQYCAGLIIPLDHVEALKWYRQSAKQGNRDAQHKLGEIYYTGYGIEQDYKEAARWYRLAAEQGDTEAQYILGLIYYNGHGFPKDYVCAHKWWAVAASNGLQRAAPKRDLVESSLSESDLAAARRQIADWHNEHQS